MLNEKQKEVFDFITNEENRYACVKILGSGGCGKTYTVAQAIRELIARGMDETHIHVIAPTHKSKFVIKESFDMPDSVVQFSTINKFFNWHITRDVNDKPVETWGGVASNLTVKAIIVDEISMLSNEGVEQIERYFAMNSFLLVLMGDDKQIPPVDSSEGNNLQGYLDGDGFRISKAFKIMGQQFVLTQPMRQMQDSQIYNLCVYFRENMHRTFNEEYFASFDKPTKDDYYKIIKHFAHKGLDVGYCNSIECYLENEKDVANSVIIAYTNMRTNLINYQVGYAKSGREDFQSKELTVGNYYMVKKTVKEIVFASEVVKIISITPKKISVNLFGVNHAKYYEFDVLELGIENSRGQTIVISRIDKSQNNWHNLTAYHVSLKKSYRDNKAKAKREKLGIKEMKAINNAVNDFKTSFVSLSLPYAITCHKSQGSTYDNVYIMVKDFAIINQKEKNQLLYVAMSRAKKKLIFIDSRGLLDTDIKNRNLSKVERNFIASNSKYKCAIMGGDLIETSYQVDHIIAYELFEYMKNFCFAKGIDFKRLKYTFLKNYAQHYLQELKDAGFLNQEYNVEANAQRIQKIHSVANLQAINIDIHQAKSAYEVSLRRKYEHIINTL